MQYFGGSDEELSETESDNANGILWHRTNGSTLHIAFENTECKKITY
jgi:hypothetical protein